MVWWSGSTFGGPWDRPVEEPAGSTRDEKKSRIHVKMMHTWIIVALFAGVVLIMVNEYASTVPERVEYRYLPRDLDEYIRTAPLPTTVFGTMFTEYDAIPGQFDHVTS